MHRHAHSADTALGKSHMRQGAHCESLGKSLLSTAGSARPCAASRYLTALDLRTAPYTPRLDFEHAVVARTLLTAVTLSGTGTSRAISAVMSTVVRKPIVVIGRGGTVDGHTGLCMQGPRRTVRGMTT